MLTTTIGVFPKPDDLPLPNWFTTKGHLDPAAALNQADFDALSLEDARRPNDLRLLERFARKTIVLGVIAIAKSRVEEVEEIRARLRAALEHIDRERLMAAPDCGLGHLGRDLAIRKLANLSRAAHSLD